MGIFTSRELRSPKSERSFPQPICFDVKRPVRVHDAELRRSLPEEEIPFRMMIALGFMEARFSRVHPARQGGFCELLRRKGRRRIEDRFPQDAKAGTR
jgi:hypothetical protein